MLIIPIFAAHFLFTIFCQKKLAMPHSRHRHKHESHQPHHHPAQPKPTRKATPIVTFLAAIFGLVVAAMASESDWLWMIIGAIVGAVAGYLIGKNIDSAADKK